MLFLIESLARKNALLVATLLACGSQTAPAQDAGPLLAAPKATLTESAHALVAAEAVGSGDLIELAVSFCPELSRTFRVTADGKLVLPLLRHPLEVAGKTPSELSEQLSTALVNDHILTDPVVNVTVIEYRSRPVNMVGAVNHPLTFQATERTTLMEALAKAGGLTPTAGANIIITTETASGSESVRVVAVKDLIRGNVPGADVALRGGEEIRIPEADKIFVAGNVRRPGAYAMQNDAETTVMKAVALSSGLDSYSGDIAYIYRRRAQGTSRDEVKIPLRKIMTRKLPDIVLLADDILYVPTAEGKRITAKVLGQLAGFGQTAEAGLLVLR